MSQEEGQSALMVISHMIWGYLLGSLTSMATKTRPNVPLLFLLGAVPDFDLYSRHPYATTLGHHGIFHSWVAITLVFLPALVWNMRTALPLFVATVQHPLFGDLIVNEVPLYYPYSLEQVGLNLYMVSSALSLGLEAVGLLLVLAVGPVRRKLYGLREPNSWNLTLLSALPLLVYGGKLSIQYLGTDLGLYAGYGLIANSLGIIVTLVSAGAYITSQLPFRGASPPKPRGRVQQKAERPRLRGG